MGTDWYIYLIYFFTHTRETALLPFHEDFSVRQCSSSNSVFAVSRGVKVIGRIEEKQQLSKLLDKSTASLVCVRGRRRIGKSTLIKNFSKGFDDFIEIQGLAPRQGNNNSKQLEHFARTISAKFKLSLRDFDDWSVAFSTLFQLLSIKKTLVFFDEISWMSKYDPDFCGKLKIAWDTQFKQKNNLVLVLCGSVSSWIKENFLNSTGFVGRLSLNIKLGDLSLVESLELLKAKKKNSLHEIIKILSVTGGVPKYLEEINLKETAEANIESLLLNKNGILFTEFDQIFNDIFDQRSNLYKRIILAIINGKKTPLEIAKTLKLPTNGDFFEYLDHLMESGFLARDTTWSIKEKKESKFTKYRIADNFLRFYLKNVDPLKSRIQKLPLKINAIKNWESIIGLQFENIIHNNYKIILPLLNLDHADVVQIGPYFQTQTTKQSSVQVDLLIQTKYNVLYCCEIKYRTKIGIEVKAESQQKNQSLHKGKNFSVRNILIYCGELSSELQESEFFDKMISFEDLCRK